MMIIESRALGCICRNYGFPTSRASSEFLRAWWAAVRRLQPSATRNPSYQAGYAAGSAWREFHGSGRVPHETHAADALQLDLIPDPAEVLRLYQGAVRSSLDVEEART